MASPIRNACIARGQLAPNQTVVVFSVPDGHVVLLKHMSLQIATTASRVLVQFQGGNPRAFITLVDWDDATVAFQHWEGWLALNPGDLVTIWAASDASYYWLSGAVLPFAASLPAGQLQLPQHQGDAFEGPPPAPWSAILSPSPTGR